MAAAKAAIFILRPHPNPSPKEKGKKSEQIHWLFQLFSE
jgi:hypothetical protein